MNGSGGHRRGCRHAAACSAAVAGLTLCCHTSALASGGDVRFEGGTVAEQAQVREALAVSTFDWGVIPQTVTVHIDPLSSGSYATPGDVYVDSSLLDSGTFSWGVVQHEFGHQVDFFVLHDDDRARLEAALHARAWCYELPDATHADQGCERFASELSWAYWPSPENSMRPASVGGESTGMAPSDFRTLLATLLGTEGISTTTPAGMLPAPTLAPGTRRTRPPRHAHGEVRSLRPPPAV
jgi:hypothetical protein